MPVGLPHESRYTVNDHMTEKDPKNISKCYREGHKSIHTFYI